MLSFKVFIMLKSGQSTTRTISTEDYIDFQAFARAVELTKKNESDSSYRNEIGILYTDSLYLDCMEVSLMYPIVSNGNFPQDPKN